MSCKRKGLFSIAGIVLMSLSSGCFFTNVGENLEQDSCVDQAPSFCNELNQLEPTGDSCLSWSCDRGDGVCKVLPFDGDSDGVPSEECAPTGEVFDCDDEDPNRTPSQEGRVIAERCDGVDNDCNGVVDEGAYVVSDSETLLSNQSIDHLSLWQDDLGAPHFVYSNSIDPTGKIQGATLGDAVGADFLQAGVSFIVQSTAAVFVPGVGPLLLAGRGNGSRALLGSTPQDGTEWAGVEADGSEDVSSLALAHGTSGNSFVGTYLQRKVNLADSCGGLAATDVVAFTGQSGVDPSFGAQRLSLGQTVDPSPAPVLALGADLWVVGMVDAAKNISLRELRTSSFATQNASELFLESLDGEAGELALAANPDGSQLAIAWREGCGNAIQLHLVLFSRSAGQLTESSRVVLPAGSTARRPSIVWQEAPSERWIVAWQESGAAIKAAHFDEGGSQLGMAYTPIQGVQGIRQGVKVTTSASGSVSFYAPTSVGLEQGELQCISP